MAAASVVINSLKSEDETESRTDSSTSGETESQSESNSSDETEEKSKEETKEETTNSSENSSEISSDSNDKAESETQSKSETDDIPLPKVNQKPTKPKTPPKPSDPPPNPPKKTFCQKYCLRITSRLIASFCFLTVIITPLLAQIIAQSVCSDPEMILLGVGWAQAGLAVLGALPFGYAAQKTRRHKNMPSYMRKKEEVRDLNYACCEPCWSFRAMFYGGFTLYFLIPWICLNIFSYLYYITNGLKFQRLTHLGIFMPLLVYGPLFLVGMVLGRYL